MPYLWSMIKFLLHLPFMHYIHWHMFYHNIKIQGVLGSNLLWALDLKILLQIILFLISDNCELRLFLEFYVMRNTGFDFCDISYVKAELIALVHLMAGNIWTTWVLFSRDFPMISPNIFPVDQHKQGHIVIFDKVILLLLPIWQQIQLHNEPKINKRNDLGIAYIMGQFFLCQIGHYLVKNKYMALFTLWLWGLEKISGSILKVWRKSIKN